jgi:hypothetical protein
VDEIGKSMTAEELAVSPRIVVENIAISLIDGVLSVNAVLDSFLFLFCQRTGLQSSAGSAYGPISRKQLRDNRFVDDGV